VAVPLDDKSRVSIPSSVLSEIAALTPRQAEHIQTELRKITAANYTPSKLVYKQYGDLKVFRCGDEMRLFGVILEDLDIVNKFDHLVILLEVSEHEYEQAGVSKHQARDIQQTFSHIDSKEEFWSRLNGAVFNENDINSLFDP